MFVTGAIFGAAPCLCTEQFQWRTAHNSQFWLVASSSFKKTEMLSV